MSIINEIIASLIGDEGKAAIGYASVSTNRVRPALDKVGIEASLGSTRVKSIRAKQYLTTDFGESRTASTLVKQIGIKMPETLTSVIGKTTEENIPKALFVYDVEFFKRAALQTGARPKSGMAHLIDVKQLVLQTLPELAPQNTRIENVYRALGLRGISIPEGREFFTNKERLQAVEEIVQEVFSRSPVEAKRFLERSVGRRFGINPLDKYASLIDEHPLQKLIGPETLNVIPVKNKLKSTVHVSNLKSLNEGLVPILESRFGKPFAETFKTFSHRLFESVDRPGDVSFLLTGGNRLFVGVTGVASTYEELPTQIGGLIGYKGKLASARNILIESKEEGVKGVKTLTEAFFDEFIKGVEEYGEGGKNVTAALEKGRKQALGTELLPGLRFKDIKGAVSTYGDISFHQAAYMQHSLVVGKESMPLLDEEIREASLKAQTFQVTKESTTERLLKAQEADLAKLEAKGIELQKITGSDVTIGKEGYEMISNKTGLSLAPYSSIRSYFPPGAQTERDLSKGAYQLGGIKETWEPLRHRVLELTRRRLGLTSAHPVGTTIGVVSEEQTMHQMLKSATGKAVIEKPLLMWQGLTTVVAPGESLKVRSMLGDQGAILTPIGRLSTQKRRALVGTEAALNASDLIDTIRTLAGVRKGEELPKQWSNILEKALQQQEVSIRDIGEGIKIKGKSSLVPRGAEVLTGISYDDWNKVYKFNWKTKAGSTLTEALLLDNQRITASVAGESFLEELFGTKALRSDIITSSETFAKAGKANILYTHMLGLLGTEKLQKAGGVARFLRLYEKHGGKGLERVGRKQQIIATSEFSFKNFLSQGAIEGPAEKALSEMGASVAQIYGLAKSSTEYGESIYELFPQAIKPGPKGPEVKGTILDEIGAKTLPTLEELREVSMKSNMFAFITNMANRTSEVTDFLNSEKSFRMRLFTLHQMGQSLPTMFGLENPMQHPIYRMEIEHLQESVPGLILNPNAKAAIGKPGGEAFVKQLPRDIKNVAYALKLPALEKLKVRGGKKYFKGVEVLTRQEAAERFINAPGGINVQMLEGEMSAKELFEKELLRKERPGFFLHTGDTPWFAPENLEAEGKVMKALPVRGTYIPSGEELRRMIGQGEFPRGSLLHSMVSLLQQPNAVYGAKEPSAATSVTVRGAFENVWRWWAKAGAKGGYFHETKLTSKKMPGSARVRLTQKIASNRSEFNLINSMEDIYSVKIQKDTLHKMAKEIAIAEGAKTPEELLAIEEDLIEKASKGKLYGAVTPRPQHAPSHQRLVKLQLIKEEVTKKLIYADQATAGVSPYLAHELSRDFDKDAIEVAIIRARHLKGTVDPEELIKKQYEMSASQRKQFDRLKIEADKALSTIEETLEGATKIEQKQLLNKYALKYFAFGRTPALSQVGSWTTLAFAQKIADTATSEKQIAEELNRLFTISAGGEYTEGIIQRYRDILGEGSEAGFAGRVERAIEMYRTPFQGALTKAGEIKDLLDDFLNIPGIIKERAESYVVGKEKPLIEETISMVEEYLTKALGATDEEVLGNIATGYGEYYVREAAKSATSGVKKAITRLAAEDLGTVIGVSAIAMQRHHGGRVIGNPMRDAFQKVKGSMASLWSFVTGEPVQNIRESMVEIAMEHSDRSAEELGEKAAKVMEKTIDKATTKASNILKDSEVLNDISAKMKGKWGLVAGIAAGLFVLRELSGIVSDVGGFAGGSAPIPRQPLLSFPEVHNLFDSQQPTANVMPVEGYNSSLNYQGGGYQDVEDITDNLGEITNRGANFSNINIRDSRKYSSNFAMSQAYKKQGVSDFTHQYQYNQ